MTLTELAIKRPSLIVVIFTLLTILGLISYNQLSYELIPKFSVPILTITTAYPGASPSEVENAITKRIEDASSSLENIKRVRSTSYESVSMVIIELNSSADVNDALRECQRKINEVIPRLPENALAPVISKISPDDFPILRYGLTSNLSTIEFYQLVKDQLKPQISSIEGVAQVSIVGGEERSIRVNVDEKRLQSYGISLLAVNQAISSSNLDFPTGKVEGASDQMRVRLAGKFTNIEDLRNLVVARFPNGGQVKLRDVAEVVDGRKDVKSINRINGISSIGISILKQGDANAVAVAQKVAEKIKQIEQQYSKQEVKIVKAVDTTEFTIAAADAVKHDLSLAIMLVAFVILIFLHSIRDSFIVMLAVPTSFVATFIAIYLFGFTLNLMTMLALTLVVGILVDDSIVVLENIHRHLHMRKDKRTAALEGRNEIGLTAIAITLVDVVVFLPLALSNGGVVSSILRQFSWVVVVATLLSLFVSFTITPLLASRISKVNHFTKSNLWGAFNLWTESQIESLTNWYAGILKWSLNNKTVTLAIVVSMFVGAMSLAGAGFIGSEFVNRGDRGEFVLNVELDKTSSLENTSAVSLQVEKMLLKMPEVERVLSNIGGNTSRESNGGEENKVEMMVKLVPAEKRTIQTSDFLIKAKDEVRKMTGVKVIGAEVDFNGSAGTAPLQLVVSGDDIDTVMNVAKELKSRVKETAGATDVKLTIEGGVPEVKIDMDKEKMASLGLNVATVGATLQNAFAGNDDSKYREKETEYDIIVMLDGFDRKNADDVKKISFINNAGKLIQLEQFAAVSPSIGPSQLERTNRITSIKLEAQLRGRQLGNVAGDIEKAIAKMDYPSSVKIDFIGDYAEQKQSFGVIGGAFLLSIILVYLLMVALYDSYVYPFVTLFSIPVAMIGAFLALALTKSSLSIFTMLGLVVLIGLVTKNAILIVDFANKGKEEGLSSFQALLESGRARLRPILMTTFAMIFGMLPVALATGSGAEWKNGLGWVLVGGLTSSMILTLVVVPAMYLIIDNIKAKIEQWRGKKEVKKESHVLVEV